jgi:hypothetical protein
MQCSQQPLRIRFFVTVWPLAMKINKRNDADANHPSIFEGLFTVVPTYLDLLAGRRSLSSNAGHAVQYVARFRGLCNSLTLSVAPNCTVYVLSVAGSIHSTLSSRNLWTHQVLVKNNQKDDMLSMHAKVPKKAVQTYVSSEHMEGCCNNSSFTEVDAYH